MRDFWSGLGVAAIILAILLGFGGCVYMCSKALEPTVEQHK